MRTHHPSWCGWAAPKQLKAARGKSPRVPQEEIVLLPGGLWSGAATSALPRCPACSPPQFLQISVSPSLSHIYVHVPFSDPTPKPSSTALAEPGQADGECAQRPHGFSSHGHPGRPQPQPATGTEPLACERLRTQEQETARRPRPCLPVSSPRHQKGELRPHHVPTTRTFKDSERSGVRRPRPHSRLWAITSPRDLVQASCPCPDSCPHHTSQNVSRRWPFCCEGLEGSCLCGLLDGPSGCAQ